MKTKHHVVVITSRFDGDTISSRGLLSVLIEGYFKPGICPRLASNRRSNCDSTGIETEIIFLYPLNKQMRWRNKIKH